MGSRGSARQDGGSSCTVALSHVEPPRAASSPDDDTRTTRKTRKTRGPDTSQQRAADQAVDRKADPLQADAERVAAEKRFHARIEHELTAELRTLLHLTLSGTSATFDWHGQSFTLTFAGFVERTRTTPSGGLSAYTLRAWCLAPADTDQQSLQNFAEGELQAGLLAYLGIQSAR
jgi:hypothetical protein